MTDPTSTEPASVDPGRSWSRHPAALVAAAVLAAAVVAVGPAPASAVGCGLTSGSGDGTPANPYQVTSAADLALVGVGDCALSASYLQTADITISTWEPLGGLAEIFVGTYDGGGNTLTFDNVNFTTAGAGLFDVVGGATFRNLTVDGKLTGKLTGAGIGSTGALAAQVRGATTETLTIEDVTMAADITGAGSTGGLLGLAEFVVEKPKVIIRRVTITGDVTGGYGSGGIIGSIRANDLIIDDAEVSGTVTSTVANAPGAWAYLGGFIGEYGGTGTISDSLFTGSIVADADYVGGFIGGFRQGPAVAGTTLTIADTSLLGGGTFSTSSRVNNWGGAIGFAAYTDGDTGPYDGQYGTLTLNRVGVRTIFNVGPGSREINCLAGIAAKFYPGSAVVLSSSAARGFRIDGVETDCGGRWGEVAPAVSRVALNCTPDPVVVGGTVTCEVTGADADFDFIWAAGAGASATRGVVTTDATGRGTFTFIALRDALGRFIGVELVAWGVTSGVNVIGRAPGAIPAGTGPAWPAVALASALLGGVLALPLLRRRRGGVPRVLGLPAVAVLSLLLAQVPAAASAPTTVADLRTALCSGGGATVALSGNVSDADATTGLLSIAPGCVAVLDLNGRDLVVNRVELGAGSTLTIRGSGSLTAQTAVVNKAGIQTTGATLNIEGGTIVAQGGEEAAGIGGGYMLDGGTIAISGGTVTATGDDYSAGIGGGYDGNGGTISISGGTVTATGGQAGAGIGSGQWGSGPSASRTGGTISISGGTVTATGGGVAAGIGGGQGAAGGTISITGGAVTATSGFVADGTAAGWPGADWYGIGGGGETPGMNPGDPPMARGVAATLTLGPSAIRTDSVSGSTSITTITFPAADGPDTSSGSGSSPVLSRSGVTPTLTPGVGVWQDGTGVETPLTVSSPGVGQVRYSAPGLQLTLTGTSGSGTGTGLVADGRGEVVCELCAFLQAGGVIEAWVFSEPRLAAAWRTDEVARVLGDLPCRRFTIPVGAPLDGGAALPPGAHTLQLVLPTTSGLQAVNVGVTVAGPVPGSIPAGEVGPADVARTVPVAAALAVLLLTVRLLGSRRVTLIR